MVLKEISIVNIFVVPNELLVDIIKLISRVVVIKGVKL